MLGKVLRLRTDDMQCLNIKPKEFFYFSKDYVALVFGEIVKMIKPKFMVI